VLVQNYKTVKRSIALLCMLVLPVLAAAQSSYLLNAGDAIRVHVYGEPDLSFNNMLVGQNGIIALPFLGELKVAGKSVSELQAVIVEGLQPDYLIDPRVSVSIVKYRPFFVNGEVRNPGGVEFQPGLTLRKAIALVGGFTERADKGKLTVIADSDPDRKEVKAALDYRVQPGDIINVEQSFF
jgi:protein involved in polysaccharide export with SLBB domain